MLLAATIVDCAALHLVHGVRHLSHPFGDFPIGVRRCLRSMVLNYWGQKLVGFAPGFASLIFIPHWYVPVPSEISPIPPNESMSEWVFNTCVVCSLSCYFSIPIDFFNKRHIFVGKKNFKEHNLIHKEGKTFECPACGKILKSKNS